MRTYGPGLLHTIVVGGPRYFCEVFPIQAFKYWRYLGQEPQELRHAQPALEIYNLKILRTCCSILFCVMMGTSVVTLLINRSLSLAVIYWLFSALLLLFLLLSSDLFCKKRRRPKGTAIVYTIVYILLLDATGAYISVFVEPDRVAVAFILFLLFTQIIFVIPPLLNLLLALCSGGVFLLFVLCYKNSNIWYYDMTHTIVALVAGQFLGWHMAQSKVGEILVNRQLELERNLFLERSITDPLTGLPNRRSFFHNLREQATQCQKDKQGLLFLLFDIDYFKQYNDHYGHPAGDDILRRIGRALKTFGQRHDAIIGRIGGEEFMLACPCPQGDDDFCQAVAECLRNQILELAVPHEYSKVAPWVTISIGFALAEAEQAPYIDVHYDNADKALYAAKESGRNRVCRYAAPDQFLPVPQGKERPPA